VPGLLDAFRWKLTTRPQPSPSFIEDVEPSMPPRRWEAGGLRTTLVNHSTVLLQQRGSNILTDPVWSERTSPLSWIGPRRCRKPGVSWEDLPPIDAVLISHNHYDHLDLPTLRRLAAREDSTFIVPVGVARLLREQNIGSAHELGFGPHFSWIRERFGSPDLALLPIGAYEPRWFMSPVHLGPDGAIRAHEILGAATSIAIHHGTFQLADDGLDTPRKQLGAYAPRAPFLLLDNGQSADIP
jgi:L-ascorbate metabolism protein UlaG (beta-lactamase superfamily)